MVQIKAGEGGGRKIAFVARCLTSLLVVGVCEFIVAATNEYITKRGAKATAAQGTGVTDFLDYVREQNCTLHRHEPAEPHHLDAVGSGRNRKQEMIEHLSGVPLCRICHMELHTIGIKTFEDRHGINLWRWQSILLARWIWMKLEH